MSRIRFRQKSVVLGGRRQDDDGKGQEKYGQMADRGSGFDSHRT